MPDEPVADEVEENIPSGGWMPALKAALSLIAVLIVLFFFYAAWDVIVYYFHDLLYLWSDSLMQYPLYDALYYLAIGALLLLLAGLLIGGRDWHEALIDRLQLKADKRRLAFFSLGVIMGAVAIIAVCTATTLSLAGLFGARLLVGFIPDLLATAAFLAIPLLVYSVGIVALIQGIFQRKLTDRYDMIVGIFAAALVYMILAFFPYHIYRLFNPQYYADIFFTGAIIAYLFHRSKSLFMPIGFLFAWKLFSSVSVAFANVTWAGDLPTFYGFPHYLSTYFIRLFIPFLVLVLIWYFGNKTRDDLNGLMSWIKNAFDVFLARIARD